VRVGFCLVATNAQTFLFGTNVPSPDDRDIRHTRQKVGLEVELLRCSAVQMTTLLVLLIHIQAYALRRCLFRECDRFATLPQLVGVFAAAIQNVEGKKGPRCSTRLG
jgi:hypothetical protein